MIFLIMTAGPGTALITLVAIQGDVAKVVSYSIYGATLFLLYLTSTLYHGLRGRAKQVFRVLDHQAIYLLIAGTYTPYMIVTLRDGNGFLILAVIWALVAGATAKPNIKLRTDSCVCSC